MSGGNSDGGATSNELADATGNVVQGRDFYGDIHFRGRSRLLRPWVWPAAFLALSLVVATAVFLWPEDGADLRVSVDLSVSATPPWAFAGESPDFPGAALAARMARPFSPQDRRLPDALRVAGGVPVEQQTVRLHLVGPDDGAVRVVDIRPVVRRTDAPMADVLVHARGQGVEASASMHLYLDDEFPVLQGTAEDDRGGRVPAGPFFPGSTINLADGETQEVVLTTFAHEKSYEYALEVEYQVGTDTRVLTVDDGGRPLRITGLACAAPGSGLAAYGQMYDLVAHDFSLRPLAEGEPQRESEC